MFMYNILYNIFHFIIIIEGKVVFSQRWADPDDCSPGLLLDMFLHDV